MSAGHVARVDVGIPAHGRPRFLAAAIESVLAQSLRDWRLVISEDGPGSDALAAALAPYLADPRVHHHLTGHNVGAAANMTGLIVGGSAPYVALLHDDDRWGPEFLSRRVAFLEDHRECGLVFSASVIIDEQGRPIDRRPPAVAAGIHTPEQFVPRLLRRNVVPIASVVVRRSAYEAVGPAFDARFPHIYDYEMWLRIATRFPVGRLDVDDCQWRRHGQQSSFDGRARGDEQLRFLAHAEAIVRRDLPHLAIPARRRRYVRSRRLLSAGLDAVEHAEPARALRLIRASVRTYPPVVVSPRLAVALAGIATGGRGRRLLGAIRLRARRNGVRLPF